MKVKGLDGRSYTWNLLNNLESSNPSSLHLEARCILKEEFPFEKILEELTIPSTSLRCDFFIPSKRIMVEVQGSQHYVYNNFHYNSQFDFIIAGKRDRQKEEFCNLNNIKLVELPYNDRDNWRQRLR